jgi:hypothetical protein
VVRALIVLLLAAALAAPASAAGARGIPGWMPPLPGGGARTSRLPTELALLARTRVSSAARLPRTGGAPGLLALTGLGLVLAGSGVLRLRP